jgi:uncharacterized protein YjiS (DUF1127 family)
MTMFLLRPAPRWSLAKALHFAALPARHLGDAVSEWLRRRRSREALEALSDRMLADIGISRSEIPGLVRIPAQRWGAHRGRH